MHSLVIKSLHVRAFRNLARLDVEWGERFNIIAGDNGHGKTNLLEALYVVSTSKSFRTSKVDELVGHHAALASVRATVCEDGEARVQSVGLKPGSRSVKIDGKRPPTLAAFAVRSPVVVFHPGELSLSMGSSQGRRRLLDRTSLYATAQSMADLDAYARAIRARQRILEDRGAHAPELFDWETLAVRHALAVMEHRACAAKLLSAHAVSAFSRIAAPDLSFEIGYAPSAPRESTEYAAELSKFRNRDLARGSASIGPHRDELSLSLNGRPARGFASQGQHRAITLSLKSAEIEAIGYARGVRPILLLDDVSSELDRDRTAALFSFLRELRGQVFLTTNRPELIVTGDDLSERREFLIAQGALVRTL
ncbi:MAG: DNA replication and repair protein RecF [Polyangiaceae bacterium]|nr:DNA replication and repair protein RecF [Polyangiaceae bacterium]